MSSFIAKKIIFQRRYHRRINPPLRWGIQCDDAELLESAMSLLRKYSLTQKSYDQLKTLICYLKSFSQIFAQVKD